MMEIDLDEQGPKTPPRIQSVNKEKAQDKADMTTAMVIDCDPTPPNTPGRKDDKGRKATAKKKGGPKLVLSKKEKETLSKWLDHMIVTTTTV